MAQMSVKLYKI